MITKLLVANRGEIAARVFRTAHTLGLATVAVYSDADADLPFVALADEAVRLPGVTPAETYLRADAVLAAARATGADAGQPGWCSSDRRRRPSRRWGTRSRRRR
jgi:propionyl-CoA carboxylase alpha chain